MDVMSKLMPAEPGILTSRCYLCKIMCAGGVVRFDDCVDLKVLVHAKKAVSYRINRLQQLEHSSM